MLEDMRIVEIGIVIGEIRWDDDLSLGNGQKGGERLRSHFSYSGGVVRVGESQISRSRIPGKISRYQQIDAEIRSWIDWNNLPRT